MKAYIAASNSDRETLQAVLQTIKDVLTANALENLVFIEQFRFGPHEEKEMMRQAMLALDSCDLLIAEASYKGIGIGIEAGYMKAKGKPVIYLRHAAAGHSTTLSGTSDRQVIYEDLADLKKKLEACLQNMPLI
jgi:2'-deoxynucleoside 5'-phosphate N-hydrolase